MRAPAAQKLLSSPSGQVLDRPPDAGGSTVPRIAPVSFAPPRLDAASFEEPAGRLYGLLIMLEHRMGGKQAGLLHHFIEAGEYGPALEGICGALAQDTVAVTDQERTAMLGLARQMTVDDLCPARWHSACGSFHRIRASRTSAPGNGGSGWISAAARLISQPARPSPAAPVNASHPMASASDTSAAATVSTTVTRT
jgi:hypothetical protein